MICEFHVYKELGSGGYTMGWVRIVTKYYPNVLYFNDISSITLFVNFVGWAVHVFFTQTHLKMTDAKSSFYALGTVAYSNRDCLVRLAFRFESFFPERFWDIYLIFIRPYKIRDVLCETPWRAGGGRAGGRAESLCPDSNSNCIHPIFTKLGQQLHLVDI